MPVSITIILVWIIIWALVTLTKNTLPLLAGKGIAQIGNQYYRFFSCWLAHKNVVHMLANVCALFWIGFLYEERMGSLRFLLVGTICAVLCEIIISFIFRDASECIGGSTFNYALLGFGLTMQFLVPDFPKLEWGTWSGNWLIIYMILSNIPFILPFVDVTTILIHLIALVLGVLAASANYFLFAQ